MSTSRPYISVFDLFKIGIGPSSSHTVGPMCAAKQFAIRLRDEKRLDQIASVRVELFGSLGFTGKGHGSDRAVILGLEGEDPKTVDIDSIPARVYRVSEMGRLRLLGERDIAFRPVEAIVFHRRGRLPLHPNGMCFTALGSEGRELTQRVCYSVGGGFIVNYEGRPEGGEALDQRVPYAFPRGLTDPLVVIDWVNLWALAVNEENAAGGRVVTASTNGAAGIIPAVLHYYDRFIPGANADGIIRFLLTAAAIGALYKKNASLSGAEVGCQGEVGVACSMAAGALAEILGGMPEQVENAAEIGMEHNLGLTCDPIGGLVQVPCIERNAMGAVKAINAARLALSGDGTHKVSLDKVIATMRRTGADMSSKYKETARGGLAVNITEC
jgi:L-serine deaminase